MSESGNRAFGAEQTLPQGPGLSRELGAHGPASRATSLGPELGHLQRAVMASVGSGWGDQTRKGVRVRVAVPLCHESAGPWGLCPSLLSSSSPLVSA